MIKQLLRKWAYWLVEDEISKSIGLRLKSDADWFIPNTPEYVAVSAIGNDLAKYGHWNIQRIREDNKLSSPARQPDRHVRLYPNGDISSSMDSSEQTYAIIEKAFEATMPKRIWSATMPKQR